MLPKKHRLSKTVDVSIATAKGRSFFSKNFIIKFFSLKDAIIAQATVVIAKKTANSAVVRNRLKRIVRDELYKFIKELKPGFYVIILKKTSVSLSSPELKDEVRQSFIRNRFIKQ